MPSTPRSRRDPAPLEEAERTVTEALGQLMEFWGFRPALGRLWALLYLSPDPLTAQRLGERLKMSSGAVSMGLQDLQRWGVIRKVWVEGERRDHYTAEEDVWKMVSRVLREREWREIDAAHAAFAQATSRLDDVPPEGAGPAVAFRRERIGELEELALAGKDLLGMLLSNESLDQALAHEQAARGGDPAPATAAAPRAVDLPDFQDP
ncbi:HTH domain-containing protein [Myxococcota bacterium]|nr:HTH domain-containing protein [Myxococcota bacterium]